MPIVKLELSEEKLATFEAFCTKLGLSRKDMINEALTLLFIFAEEIDEGGSLPTVSREHDGEARAIVTPGLAAYEKRVKGEA
ncbi:MAG TPA: hypothetical protein VE954_43280 [Oligoflexus sp.]|uniref:hypothetical protein n=1 Tax=Oligoflexus sp. TaxID=1971216 RepID=UPI002D60EB1F|nr:hypothetical protein [Oligoflexus sp.]HYX39968.1 hypothetical protein [Oligoflexus sp.]